MIATIDRKGQIILQAKTQENLKLRSGDVLVVNYAADGQIVLKKRPHGVRTRSHKNYLNPTPLRRGVLERIYRTVDSKWEKVEQEATLINRHALAGKRIEDL